HSFTPKILGHCRRRIHCSSNISTLTRAQKELKKNKAIFILQQAAADTIFPRLMGATSAKEAWSTLHEKFQESIKFELIKMKKFETVKDHYSKIKEIVS
ncbi:hypothetical protein CR513_45948, partial [Mucuna pruriens]